MNWAAISAVVSAATLLFMVGGFFYTWGTMTEKISGQTLRLDEHRDSLSNQESRLNAHDVQIGRLEEWKAGYNAAARVGGHTPEVV